MKLLLITTGGTIDKIYHDARNDYEVGSPQVVELLVEAQVAFDYQVRSVLQKDSLEMTDEDRTRVRDEITVASETHVVVTHGTDTMVETAMCLTDIPNKVIVLTGSLSPARFKTSDAEFNLGMAVAAVQTLPPGVYISMNGQVFKADEVRKNRDTNAFESIK